MLEFFNALKILSYNAIFTFIISNRNYGKTWALKRRAWRRAVKHGKKTLWVRTFRKEVKETINTFFTSKDLQNYCGIIPYNADTKEGNFKQEGYKFYCKRGKSWLCFLKIVALSDSNAMRSADDVDLDTIVYDEFTTTSDKLKRYRGNIVNDFIDTFISAKRNHKVRAIFLGNKENVLNPFFSYFNIPPLPLSFEGIKTFRNGSIVLQQIDNKPRERDEYDIKIRNLLSGTTYGDYLYNGTYKNQIAIQTRKTPQDASEYIQLCINNYEIKISVLNGFFYVNNSIDVNRRVYVLDNLYKYRNEYMLVKRQKRLFIALVNALADRRVYYNDLQTYQAIQPFYRWLNI